MLRKLPRLRWLSEKYAVMTSTAASLP